jgi:hypothetical protein
VDKLKTYGKQRITQHKTTKNMLVGKPENDFLCCMARRSACHVKEKNKMVVREVIVCWLPILTLFFVHDNVKE